MGALRRGVREGRPSSGRRSAREFLGSVRASRGQRALRGRLGAQIDRIHVTLHVAPERPQGSPGAEPGHAEQGCIRRDATSLCSLLVAVRHRRLSATASSSRRAIGSAPRSRSWPSLGVRHEKNVATRTGVGWNRVGNPGPRKLFRSALDPSHAAHIGGTPEVCRQMKTNWMIDDTTNLTKICEAAGWHLERCIESLLTNGFSLRDSEAFARFAIAERLTITSIWKKAVTEAQYARLSIVPSR